MMKRQLNHSRHIDYYAKDIADEAYHRAKHTPTAKQIKFYKKLYAMCKENDIDPNTGEYTRTRGDYADAIDILIQRLNEHGVDVKGNGKVADRVLEIGYDHRMRLTTTEHLHVKEGQNNGDA